MADPGGYCRNKMQYSFGTKPCMFSTCYTGFANRKPAMSTLSLERSHYDPRSPEDTGLLLFYFVFVFIFLEKRNATVVYAVTP